MGRRGVEVKIITCPRCGERRSNAGMLGSTGVCLICAEEELKRLREESDLWQKTEKAWYAEKRQLLQELAQLRGIKRALSVLGDCPLGDPWYVLAETMRLKVKGLTAWARIIDSIADALEAE